MKNNVIKGASILSAILMLSVVMTPVLAAEVQPFNRWGYASDGAGPLDTVAIYGWCDGVEFGMDVTGTGGDIGLFSIDVFGDSTDSPTIKTGGWNGDTVQYTIGDLTTTGTFFAETDSWLVGGFNTAPADLNAVASTPDLMKISKISIAPLPYIGIYGAGTVTDFALDINNGGAVQITGGDVLGTVGMTTYINPAAFGGISNDDALTISEAATGFIVDRVEFGTINVEPQETTMNNAGNPPATQEITRTPALDTDTNDCLADFTLGPVWSPGTVDATATGPVGIGGASIDIAYTTNGAPASVDVFVSENGGNFVLVGTDSPADGLFPYVCPGVTGDQYDFICNVPGGDDDGVGIPGGPAEAGSWELDLGGVTTAWDLFNGRNYRTFTSTVTGGWMASNLLEDIVAYINTNYGEDLTNNDVTLTRYTGSFEQCFWFMDSFWLNDFAVMEGDGYIVEILNDKLDVQPTSYELPNFEIPATVQIDVYNGRNYVGFPVVTTATMASALLEEVVAEINADYTEDLTYNDVTLTRYTGSFEQCFWFMDSFWLNDFALDAQDGYILEILNDKLDVQPRQFTP